MSVITYKPISVVHLPFMEPKNVPMQAATSKGAKGTVEVYLEYVESLKDL